MRNAFSKQYEETLEMFAVRRDVKVEEMRAFFEASWDIHQKNGAELQYLSHFKALAQANLDSDYYSYFAEFIILNKLIENFGEEFQVLFNINSNNTDITISVDGMTLNLEVTAIIPTRIDMAISDLLAFARRVSSGKILSLEIHKKNGWIEIIRGARDLLNSGKYEHQSRDFELKILQEDDNRAETILIPPAHVFFMGEQNNNLKTLLLQKLGDKQKIQQLKLAHLLAVYCYDIRFADESLGATIKHALAELEATNVRAVFWIDRWDKGALKVVTTN